MRVGMRMTVTMSIVVALTLSVFAALQLRSSSAQRASSLRRGIEDIALSTRYHIEANGVANSLSNASQLEESMSQAIAPYRVRLFSPQNAPELTTAIRKRIQAIMEGRSSFLYSEEEEEIIYTLPLRQRSVLRVEGFEAVAVVEVSIDSTLLKNAAIDDLKTTIPLVLGIILIVFFVLFFLTRSLVTAPIKKLLTGVDDVAHGDLSRVLLAEREDEIGELAARFNEMTFSLRESKSQTKLHNETRMNLEQRLFQTEKLATIGQIAAEIAHEVGTPLNVISGRAKGLLRKSTNPEAVKKNATIIAEQSARITRIIQRLLDFSRRKVGVEENSSVNLNHIVENTLEFLDSKLTTAGVKHSFSPAAELPFFLGNPDQILQIMTNLILNAAEAMENGGKVSIKTGAMIRRRPGLGIAPEVSVVVVTVNDSGTGIPEEERDKIFEPFYSSKTRDGGTGLGLAVVHGIVKAHDGWIELSDAPGGGASFSVYFPADAKPKENLVLS